MWELIALALYSVQWLGVVLGVGAQAVLLVGHLSALHAHKPQWLGVMPAVRTVQRCGLTLIVVSGLCAVLFQSVVDPTVFAIPVFGFKWGLVALAWISFMLGRATSANNPWVEGFAGATWLALFLVHSVAPSEISLVTLASSYAIWLALFGVLWTGAVTVLSRAAAPQVKPAVPVAKPIVKVAPAPVPVQPKPVVVPPLKPAPVVVAAPPPPPPPKPAPIVPPKPVVVAAPPPPPPKPAPMVAPKPTVVAAPPPPPPKPVPPPPPPAPKPAPVVVHAPTPPASPVAPAKSHVSLWQRFMALFARKPKAANPVVVAPVPTPSPQLKPTPPPVPPVPTMAAASAPIAPKMLIRPAPRPEAKPPVATPPNVAPKPLQPGANLPVVEHLELMPPGKPNAAPVAAAPTPPPETSYMPDWANLPGVRVMPQKPEDLAKESRAPLVRG